MLTKDSSLSDLVNYTTLNNSFFYSKEGKLFLGGNKEATAKTEMFKILVDKYKPTLLRILADKEYICPICDNKLSFASYSSFNILCCGKYSFQDLTRDNNGNIHFLNISRKNRKSSEFLGFFIPPTFTQCEHCKETRNIFLNLCQLCWNQLVKDWEIITKKKFEFKEIFTSSTYKIDNVEKLSFDRFTNKIEIGLIS